MSGNIPTLSDLYSLAKQLDLDSEMPVQAARERDHAIATECGNLPDTAKLIFWSRAVAARRSGHLLPDEPWLTEASTAALGRLLAFFFGCSAMAAFLLSSGRGLVNVFLFMLLFVIVQLLLCLVAAAVMARAVGGRQQTVVLPVNPARLLVARLFPDRRYLREAQSVLQVLFLRYGQEFGAIFTLGAVAAFFVVLALSDFTFVWGSTFQLSDSLVEELTSLVALPWSAWLPQATVSADLIFASRYHPAITSLSPVNIEDMRGWWPFLIMCVASYALLPRLVLWLLSRFFYSRQMRTALTGLPGSARILARMNTPLVQTQGEGGIERPPESVRIISKPDQRLLLLNWANALTTDTLHRFEVFNTVAQENIIKAGLGSLPAELAGLEDKLGPPAQHLLVAVKSWEPPLADLADVLANFTRLRSCSLCLVPLPRKPVSANQLADWQVFARALAFDVVDVQVLESE